MPVNNKQLNATSVPCALLFTQIMRHLISKMEMDKPYMQLGLKAVHLGLFKCQYM